MSMAGVKAGIVTALLLGSVLAPFVCRYTGQVKWRHGDELKRQQAEQFQQLSMEKQRLSKLLEEARSTSAEMRELLRLRSEVQGLRRMASELESARMKHQQLVANRSNLAVTLTAPALPDPRTVRAYWPKTQLALAGYGDPASALQTALWAMCKADPDILAASVTSEARSQLTREKWDKHDSPAEEIAAATRLIAESLSPASGFYIIGQTANPPEEEMLEVYFEGEGKTRKVEMKKVDQEWKLESLGGAWP